MFMGVHKGINDLPAHVCYLQIDRYAIVLALMPEAPSEDASRRFRIE